MKQIKKLSLNILRTELSVAMDYINAQNYGYASDVMQHILNRVGEYRFGVDTKKLVSDAFDAGSAWAVGGHKDFKQTHKNKQEYIKEVLK